MTRYFSAILVVSVGVLAPQGLSAQDSVHSGRVLHERLPRPMPSTTVPGGTPGVFEVVAPEETALPELPTTLSLDDRTDWVDPVSSVCVFDPCLGPMKRITAWDFIDSSMNLSGNLEGMKKTSVGAIEYNGEQTQLFRFSMTIPVEKNQPTPMPSVSPNMHVIQLQAIPARDNLQLWKDNTDNFYVSASSDGAIRLEGLVVAQRSYFEGAIDELDMLHQRLTPELQPNPSFARETLAVLSAAGITLGETSQGEALTALVTFFREFKQGELLPGKGTTLTRVIAQKTGVCRHRAFGFLLGAKAIGISARVVSNETHVFVEVNLGAPGAPLWHQIDLGGGLPPTSPGEDSSTESWPLWEPDIFAIPAMPPSSNTPVPNATDGSPPVVSQPAGLRIQFLELPPTVNVGNSVSFSVRIEDMEGSPVPDWTGSLLLVPMGGDPIHVDKGVTNSVGAIRWNMAIPKTLAPGHYRFRVVPDLPGN